MPELDAHRHTQQPHRHDWQPLDPGSDKQTFEWCPDCGAIRPTEADQ